MKIEINLSRRISEVSFLTKKQRFVRSMLKNGHQVIHVHALLTPGLSKLNRTPAGNEHTYKDYEKRSP
jgi:hypothetical protein